MALVASELIATTDASAWVGQQIRSLRELRGWNQSALANRLARSQTTISRWESGRRLPGFNDLIDLCDACDVEIDLFVPPERVRRGGTALVRATVERLAGRELTLDVNALLAEVEGAAMPTAVLSVSAPHASYLASEVLEKSNVGGPPVDVHAVARRCGVAVFKRSLPDAVAGLVFWHDEGAVIGVNSSHTRVRRRFSIARELGHFLMGQRLHVNVTEGVPPCYDWRAERVAVEFAADLLMPRRLVAEEFERTPSSSRLARRFAVSDLAMSYRLANLGFR